MSRRKLPNLFTTLFFYHARKVICVKHKLETILHSIFLVINLGCSFCKHHSVLIYVSWLPTNWDAQISLFSVLGTICVDHALAPVASWMNKRLGVPYGGGATWARRRGPGSPRSHRLTNIMNCLSVNQASPTVHPLCSCAWWVACRSVCYWMKVKSSGTKPVEHCLMIWQCRIAILKLFCVHFWQTVIAGFATITLQCYL